jgi:hypothetical protein
VTFLVVITKDRQPGSFCWTIRAVERVFGPLEWIDAEAAGVDERDGYVVECAKAENA